MQTVGEVMSRNARSITPQETLQHAAKLMDELDVGALPVCNGERLVGMVTDRDIAIRGAAAGKSPHSAHVEDVMSTEVRWCFEDEPLDDVIQQMSYNQIRRLPVISHDDSHRLVGMVSLGDLAIKAPDEARAGVEQLIEQISAPSRRGPMGGESDVTSSDSGSAAVPSGGADGTGTTGLAGIGTAGGTGSTGTGATDSSTDENQRKNAEVLNNLGPAGDYSR
ncbi:MAG TPA: CBS domain-containing protein [Noviherbaspirillum sp.]|uniref:CBS domain-containing protein n=1 Tax=Noviherbaspirillum sp. TaxID=1926288 RepID=UPI002DDD6571|nr:CBS domain-containing protein [Noviherbaspirillum sp.]HEV2611805.1 CBS domain-containing protein [Noviherbaspirillum sp.]